VAAAATLVLVAGLPCFAGVLMVAVDEVVTAIRER